MAKQQLGALTVENTTADIRGVPQLSNWFGWCWNDVYFIMHIHKRYLPFYSRNTIGKARFNGGSGTGELFRTVGSGVSLHNHHDTVINVITRLSSWEGWYRKSTNQITRLPVLYFPNIRPEVELFQMAEADVRIEVCKLSSRNTKQFYSRQQRPPRWI